jgi:hypothetical protein
MNLIEITIRILNLEVVGTEMSFEFGLHVFKYSKHAKGLFSIEHELLPYKGSLEDVHY